MKSRPLKTTTFSIISANFASNQRFGVAWATFQSAPSVMFRAQTTVINAQIIVKITNHFSLTLRSASQRCRMENLWLAR